MSYRTLRFNFVAIPCATYAGVKGNIKQRERMKTGMRRKMVVSVVAFAHKCKKEHINYKLH